MINDESPESFYKVNFELVRKHGFSLTEIENMMPFEREIFINLLIVALRDEAEARKK